MKITPRLSKVYPELTLFPSEEERIAVFKRVQHRLYRTRHFWFFVLVWSLVQAGVGLSIPHLYLPFITTRSQKLIAASVIGCWVGTVFVVGFQYLWRRPMQRMMREELKARGIPICMHCGYDVRAQTEPRCPECGEKI